LIPAAELRARVVVSGVPKGNTELLKFDGTLKQVAGQDATVHLKTDVDSHGFTEFKTLMTDAKGQEATGALKTKVDSAGFTDFKVRMTDARLQAARPIVAEARLKYSSGAFSSLRRDIFLTQQAMDGLGGSGGGLGSALSGAAMPFGKIGTAAIAAGGPVLSLVGGVTALGGSLAGAAEGAGALGIAAGGVAAVGLGGLLAIAIPAVSSLKALTEAQKSYIAAVETYGVQSTQAETAGKKLQAVEKMSGKEAVGLVKNLDDVKERWASITKPGREAFLGGLSDAIDRVDKKLPLLGNAANRSAEVGRKGFDSFLGQVTGSDFDKFVKTMTRTEEHIVPQLSKATGDWGQILERVATDAAPSLERVVGIFSHWSNEVLASTGNSHKLSGEISHLTTDFMDWVHLLTASGSLLKDIFDAGEGSGNELVVDTTKQFNEWGEWIDHHGPQVEHFFAQTKQGVETLASILGHVGQDWFVMSQAMEPVEELILHILDDFARVKIGGQSMLTYLLGGFALLKVAIAALKIKDLVEGFQALRSLTASTATQTEIETGALQAQADAASAAAAANAELAASNQAVTDSAQLSMLETGPLGAAEKAGQQSMFPMGAGVMPVAAEAEAPIAAGATAGASKLSMLGKASVYGIGGLMVGQVVKEVGHSELANKVGAAIQGAGVGAAIGSIIAPGIGTAIGAAIGGTGGFVLQAISENKSDIEAAGAKQAEDFIRGFRKEQPKLKQDVRTGFLGHAGKSMMIPGPPGSGIQFENRTGNTGLRGKRNELNLELREAKSSNQPKAAAAFEKEIAAIDQAIAAVKKARSTFGTSVKDMKGDIVLGMGAVNNDLVASLKQADTAWGHGTKQWRSHVADAMQGAAAAIKTGIDDGTINAEKGQKRINQILERIHLVKGNDPFGLAEATSKQFKQANEITSSGVRGWERKLEQMPPAARRTTTQATEGMLAAWAQGHPKLEAQVSSLVRFQTQKMGHGASQMVAQASGAMVGVAESFGSGADNVRKAIGNIMENMSAALAAEGSKAHPKFSLKVLSAASTYHNLREKTEPGFQAGGFIVGGSGSGDRPGYTGEPGGFVLNRNATAAHGFASGGQIPLALEPGERYFSPPEVQRIGAHNLASMNSSVKRFQKGGALGPEPMITGPAGSLRDIGQEAVHQVHAGAAAYLAAHAPKGGGNAEYVGGGGPVAAQMWKSLSASGYNKIGAAGVIGNAGQESGLNPASVGSGGGGLLGFTSGEISLSALQAFAKAQRKPWTDTGLQMQFFLDHEAGIRSGVNSQSDAGAAAAYFMNNWEHPAVATENQAHREEVARWAFSQGYQSGGIVPAAAGRGHKPNKKWNGWTPDGRYAPGTSTAQHLITGGEALSIPTTIAPTPSTTQVAAEKATKEQEQAAREAASKSTPTEAVHWEMSHLGDSDQWGYPGEWCGAFQAAGMEAVGITPPSGFAMASSWANFGTPLGREHVQAGAILDYGSAHVAMAISSSQQIQGNDQNGQVGTSSIGGVIGGSTLTAVRWPPYKGTTGPGAGAAPVEKVPARFNGVATKQISIGSSTPKTIHGIQREEARRKSEKRAYEQAVTAAAGRPKLVTALQHNVTALETRLSQLRKAASKLREEISKKHFSAHLGKSLGNVTGFENQIALAQRDYQEKSEFAQRITELEPTEPIVAASTLPATATEAEQLAAEKQRQASEEAYVGQLAGYIHGQVEPAYMGVLESEATWRDTILGGEQAASGFTQNQEFRVRVLEHGIETINKLTESTAAEAKAWADSNEGKKWRKEHPGQNYPSWLQGRIETAADQRETLPMLRFEEAERRKALGEGRAEFYGGRKKPLQPPVPPLAGTGTFEQSLIEVQGTHWPGLHSPVKHLPTTRSASGFGGAIWDTQTQMSELGLQIAQASASISPAGTGEGAGAATSTGNTELLELELEQARQANQRLLVKGALEPTLSQFVGTYPTAPPYMGAFAKGGVAMVGERGPELVGLPNGTRVHSNADTERMLGGRELQVVVNGHINQEPGDPRDPIEILEKDPRAARWVRQVHATTQKPVGRGGPGRAYRP
jgi:hypothetical protein